jgi:hypothetical protein
MGKCRVEPEDAKPRTLMQVQEADAKRRELEARIRATDALSKLLIDKAAQRDIELHRLVYSLVRKA